MKHLFHTLALLALSASLAGAQGKPEPNLRPDKADLPVEIVLKDKWGRSVQMAPGGGQSLASGQMGFIGSTNGYLGCSAALSNSNAGFTDDVDTYAGSGWMENGPDVTYEVNLTQAAEVTFTLGNMTADLDLFLMSNQNSNSCFAVGNSSITTVLRPGRYWLNVDGFQGAVSAFTLTVNCRCIPNRSIDNATDQMDLLTIAGSYSASAPQPSARNPAYGQMTPVPAVTAGRRVPISIMHTGYAHNHRMFVDYNNNDVFEADELVKEWTPATLQLDDWFAVDPAKYAYHNGIATTNRRFRVQSSAGNFYAQDACSQVTYGSTIDGWLQIAAPTMSVSVNGPVCLGGVTTFSIDPGVDDVPANTQFVIGISRANPAAGDSTIVITNTLAQGYVFPASFKTYPTDQISLYNTKYAANVLRTPIAYSDGPAITAVTAGTRCGAGSVALSATSAGNYIDWYTVASGGARVGTGSPWTTPALAGTTYYYAAARTPQGCAGRIRTAVKAEITPAPAVTAITPMQGVAGTPVALEGSSLEGTQVFFNGTEAAHTGNSYVRNTHVPANAATGRITITKAGCPTFTSAADFTISTPSQSADWRWVRRTVSNGADRVNRVRTDKDGFYYTAGAYSESASQQGWGPAGDQVYQLQNRGGLDGVLTRYNKQGRLLWTVTFGSTGDDEVLGLATDRFGYAYVSGYFSGTMYARSWDGSQNALVSAGGKDAFVAKVHPATGKVVYLFRFGAAGNDQASGIDVAPDLRFYVAGSFVGTTAVTGISGTAVTLTSRGNSDAFMAKFSDIGTMYWVVQAGGMGNDFAYGAAADKFGGGYLMGSYEGTSTFNSTLPGTQPIAKTAVGGSDGFVMRVDIKGALKWVSSMGGTTNENVRDLAPDPRGTGVVAVGGFSQSATFGPTALTAIGFYDAFATRLDTNGGFQWTTRAGGFGQDQAWGVRLDRSGNPLVALHISQQARNFGGTANTLTANGGTDALIVKLNAANGAAQWQAQAGAGSDDQARGIDTAAAGGALAGGMHGAAARFGVWGPYEDQTNLGEGWVAVYGLPAATARQGEEAPASSNPEPTALSLYPNPSRGGSFSLRAEGLQPGQTLEVVGMDGRIAYTLPLTEAHLLSGERIETGLKPGLYLVRCGTRQTRLVVQ